MKKPVTKSPATKPKIGRPPLEIDEKVVAGLARIDCTMKEIAAVVGCTVQTLENRFLDVIQKNREEGHASIRRQQYKLAMGGNPTMLIWLGKVQLGQRETVVNEHTGKDGGPILFADLHSAAAGDE